MICRELIGFLKVEKKKKKNEKEMKKKKEAIVYRLSVRA
jgi:hypothetical protein